jgi:hypothetical protein
MRELGPRNRPVISATQARIRGLFCIACFTGNYPTRVPHKVEKLRFEPAPA